MLIAQRSDCATTVTTIVPIVNNDLALNAAEKLYPSHQWSTRQLLTVPEQIIIVVEWPH